MIETKDIREYLDGWAKWRCGYRNGWGTGWPHRTILGQLRDHMPSAKCTVCNGTGKARLDAVGGMGQAFIPCPNCEGGRIKETDPRANPAFIRGQGPRYEPSFPIYETIDKTVAQWGTQDKKIKYYFVIIYEYTRPGDQQIKAEKLHISRTAYQTHLMRAHIQIQTILGDLGEKIPPNYLSPRIDKV